MELGYPRVNFYERERVLTVARPAGPASGYRGRLSGRNRSVEMRLPAGKEDSNPCLEESGPKRPVPGEDPRLHPSSEVYERVVPLGLAGHHLESLGEFAGGPRLRIASARHALELPEHRRGHHDVGAVDLEIDLLFETEMRRERQQERVRVDHDDRSARKKRHFTRAA
jgi:hypothetical protein